MTKINYSYWANVGLYAAIAGLTAYESVDAITLKSGLGIVLAILIAVKAKLSQGSEGSSDSTQTSSVKVTTTTPVSE